ERQPGLDRYARDAAPEKRRQPGAGGLARADGRGAALGVVFRREAVRPAVLCRREGKCRGKRGVRGGGEVCRGAQVMNHGAANGVRQIPNPNSNPKSQGGLAALARQRARDLSRGRWTAERSDAALG